MVHMLHVQYIITEIRNGCQTAIQPFLSKINPKIDFFFRLTVILQGFMNIVWKLVV